MMLNLEVIILKYIIIKNIKIKEKVNNFILIIIINKNEDKYSRYFNIEYNNYKWYNIEIKA